MEQKRSQESSKKAYKHEFLKFLKARIQKMGGKIPLRHIPGHFSQLRPEVKSAIGTSKSDLVRFLDEYCNTFTVEDGIVSLISVNFKDYDSDDSCSDAEGSLPPSISNGKGVVVKLTPSFGFITTQQPIKTSVFFRAHHFGFASDKDLTDSGINIGTSVYFDAKKEKKAKFSSKYHASKVWRANANDDQPIISNVRKKQDTGLYDPINLEGEGTVQNVFPSHGFILVDGDRKNTVFFYKNCVLNYDNITDLTKLFSTGDMVEFCSFRTTKPDAKARWEATKVWKKSKKPSSVKNSNTLPLSSSSATSSVTSKSSFRVPTEKFSDYCSQYVENIKVIPRNQKQEMIYDQVGKICPRPSGCVIKFGENFQCLADGDSSLYFVDGTGVRDVSWTFTEGEVVKFDAVKIKSTPGWKALLVWIGKKPDIVASPNWTGIDGLTDDEIEVTDDSKSSFSGHEEILCQLSLPKSESLCLETDEYLAKNSGNYELDSGNEETNVDYDTKIDSLSASPLSTTPGSSSSCSKKSEASCHLHLKQNLRKIDSSAENKSDSNSDKIANISEKQVSETEEDFELVEKAPDLELGEIQNSKKSAGSIKKYEKVEAAITKVFSMLAEAKACDIQYTIAFSKNIFYINGDSMNDLDLSDLREVLKVGQNIFFNGFQITDDEGQCWTKTTSVWIGQKPRNIFELNPMEFIEQNNLTVSVRDITLEEIPTISDYQQYFKHLKVLEDADQENETLPKLSENSGEEISQKLLSEADVSENHFLDLKLFSSMIYLKLLERKDDCLKSQEDLEVLSSDIVNFIQQKFSKSSNNSAKHGTSNCSCQQGETKLLYSQNDHTNDVEVQTFSTGPIWFPTIYVDDIDC